MGVVCARRIIHVLPYIAHDNALSEGIHLMTSDIDLLEKVSEAAVEGTRDRDLNRLIDNIVREVRGFAEAKANEIKKLSDIGIALSAQRDLDRLLERIVDDAREFTSADGGTLYSVDGNSTNTDPVLKFSILQTETLGTRQGGTSGNPVTLPPVPMVVDGRPNESNVSAYVANSGETVNIPDVYIAEGFDFSGPRKFDQITGYRTKSMLVAPLRNHEDEIIGVLQLINARDDAGKVIPFSPEYEDLIKSLASQAAVAITNTQLFHDLQAMLDSLIRLVASAIDEKSPYTGGHIARVAGLTMEIAHEINEVSDGEYGDISFSEDELKELRIAGWLHDIGKITTPEYVVDKATKLETIFDRVEFVKTRFDMIKRGMQVEALERKLELLRAGASENELAALDDALTERTQKIDEEKEFIARCNTPGEFLQDDAIDRLKAIAAKTYVLDGEELPYLSEDELMNLSIRKGSLTDEERHIIQNHVVVTSKMLSQIPFSRKMGNVVEYAGAHHEKLNGGGYPNGWGADQLKLQSRILCLADICEALTARDRPYKPAMPKDRAFQILGFMVKDGEIDGDLLDFFKEHDVYDKFMARYALEKTEHFLDVERGTTIDGTKMLALGMSKVYKANRDAEPEIICDPFMSRLLTKYAENGVDVSFYDNHVESIRVQNRDMKSLAGPPARNIDADFVLVVNKADDMDYVKFAEDNPDLLIIDLGNQIKRTLHPELVNVHVP